jgi:transposase
VSELDKALAALEARRAQEEAERQKRRNLACHFLRSFHENDVKPSARLKARGIEASFHDGRLVLRRPDEGDFAEPLIIVVGEQGEIDVGGKSLGRFQPGEETEKKNALIAEIIAHFNF